MPKELTVTQLAIDTLQAALVLKKLLPTKTGKDRRQVIAWERKLSRWRKRLQNPNEIEQKKQQTQLNKRLHHLDEACHQAINDVFNLLE